MSFGVIRLYKIIIRKLRYYHCTRVAFSKYSEININKYVITRLEAKKKKKKNHFPITDPQ